MAYINGNEVLFSPNVTLKAGVGVATKEQGEIFNWYADGEVSIGSIAGLDIGTQELPKNQASEYAHAEGVSTTALGKGSHAEGVGTKADAEAAHAEGAGTFVTGASSHAEGRGMYFSVNVTAISDKIVTVKSNNPSAVMRVIELEAIHKYGAVWYEANADTHEGSYYYITAVELQETLGIVSGCKITLDRKPSFTKGKNLMIIMGGALSYMSHAEGNCCTTMNVDAVNLYDSKDSGKQRQHAEGNHTLAIGYAAHAEGDTTLASGSQSHSEGLNTRATNVASHAEGYSSRATNDYAHAEGIGTKAEGLASHTEGSSTQATATAAHAGGIGTKAILDGQTTIGTYNETNTKSLFIVGNGESDAARSNAFEVRQNGSVVIGGVTLTPEKLQALLNLLS